MISAAWNHLICPLIARRITSCTFITRSTPRGRYSSIPASPLGEKMLLLTPRPLHRTDYVLTGPDTSRTNDTGWKHRIELTTCNMDTP